jgi:hypothetical protein
MGAVALGLVRFGDGLRQRAKSREGRYWRSSYVKNLVSDLALVLAHRRVTGKKAIIRSISQEIVTETA